MLICDIGCILTLWLLVVIFYHLMTNDLLSMIWHHWASGVSLVVEDSLVHSNFWSCPQNNEQQCFDFLGFIQEQTEEFSVSWCLHREHCVNSGMHRRSACRGRTTSHCCYKAPVYLSNWCIPVSQVASRRHLHSAARHQLTVPRHRLGTYGRRAFAVAGPTMFNTLRDPAVSTSTFRQSLKTHLFSVYQHV